MMRLACALLILAPAGWGAVYAGDANPADPLAWLDRMAAAARQISYRGTFIYEHGKHIETSRITHVNDATGEHEKLETLDGPVREIVRKNEDILCYLPEFKTIKLERSQGRRFFPALVTAPVAAFAENYELTLGGMERVAGFGCQVLILQPKDKMRFGHRLCAERQSGLLLKSTIYTEKDEPLEQFVFTQLAIGQQIDPSSLKSNYDDDAARWKEDTSALEAKPIDSGWIVANPPAGFKKIMEMRRHLIGRSSPLYHLVFSDGLAAVSIFIEPWPGTQVPSQGAWQGAVHYYVNKVEDYKVTVLGEVPAASVLQFGNSVALRGNQ